MAANMPARKMARTVADAGMKSFERPINSEHGMNLVFRARMRGVAGSLIISVAVLLGGCAVGPNYKRPTVESPANYRFATSETTNSLGDLPWWEVFKDPLLQGHIATALSNNYDLKQAVARVEEARNLVTVARAPLFPEVGYSGGVGRGRNALFNSPAGTIGATLSSADVLLSATWEIDIWGRIRRLTEAA